jgi:hypothetical protein
MVNIFLLTFSLLIPRIGMAYNEGLYYGGLGYYTQNANLRTTTNDSGKASTLGTTSLPIVFKYDMQLGYNWFFSPELFTTFLYPRWTGDGAERVTLTHLMLPVGAAISSSNWDWSAGIGILNTEIKGSGGTKVMSNGTGTATFAVPSRASTIRTMTLIGGLAYNFNGRWGLDLVIEGALSNGKRAQSLMLSYLFPIGGR